MNFLKGEKDFQERNERMLKGVQKEKEFCCWFSKFYEFWRAHSQKKKKNWILIRDLIGPK